MSMLLWNIFFEKLKNCDCATSLSNVNVIQLIHHCCHPQYKLMKTRKCLFNTTHCLSSQSLPTRPFHNCLSVFLPAMLCSQQQRSSPIDSWFSIKRVYSPRGSLSLNNIEVPFWNKNVPGEGMLIDPLRGLIGFRYAFAYCGISSKCQSRPELHFN